MVEWIIAVITSSGYVGITLLMFAENLFPPIPSELIMPFAGFVAARGELHPVGVVAAGVAGSLLGAIPWYLAGRWLGGERLKRLADRHGRWLPPDTTWSAQKTGSTDMARSPYCWDGWSPQYAR